jgi:ABC-type transport system substrate-binding protein
MRSIASRLFAAISCAGLAAQLCASPSATASARPRYGGVLRVELHTATVSLDPRTWRVGSLEAATNEKLASLVFERLVTLDAYGRFQPVLATEWSHDSSSRHWQFVIRPGVRFSDGTPLLAGDVAAALQPLLPNALQVSASATSVLIQSGAAVPDLLEQLASGRYFVFRVQPSGALVGSGPFVLDGGSAAAPSAVTGSHLVFRENEDAWSGRPFLDAIDVMLGVPPLRAMFDLQLGKADLIELAPDLAPRAKQANLRVWSSDPVVLYGLCFEDTPNGVSDALLRESLSLALDRGTMANVLLQKQAQPAAALLPQWLSGYAFLFNVDANLERAKELHRSLTGANSEPLRLRVEPSGDLPKLLGERVAVNARQAAIAIQVVNRPVQRSGMALPASATSASTSSTEPDSGIRLFAWRYSSLSPRVELDSMFAAFALAESSNAAPPSAEAEQLYARERRVLGEWRVLPLVQQAESVGIGTTVRDWMPSRWGEWQLADVWLDIAEPAQSNDLNAPADSAKAAKNLAAPVGAKP